MRICYTSIELQVCSQDPFLESLHRQLRIRTALFMRDKYQIKRKFKTADYVISIPTQLLLIVKQNCNMCMMQWNLARYMQPCLNFSLILQDKDVSCKELSSPRYTFNPNLTKTNDSGFVSPFLPAFIVSPTST